MAPYQFGVCAGSFRGRTFVCARTDGSELPVTVWATAGSAALRDPRAVVELVRQPLRANGPKRAAAHRRRFT